MNPADIQWSRNHFNLLSLNAIWGLPRSGLVFKKVSRLELALDSVMPWSDTMDQGFQQFSGKSTVPSEMERRLYQRSDFETILRTFGAAGIEVTDPRQLLKD